MYYNPSIRSWIFCSPYPYLTIVWVKTNCFYCAKSHTYNSTLTKLLSWYLLCKIPHLQLHTYQATFVICTVKVYLNIFGLLSSFLIELLLFTQFRSTHVPSSRHKQRWIIFTNYDVIYFCHTLWINHLVC